jgi:hypothetical protein
MICLGDARVISVLPDGFKVYNFMSTMEGLEKIELLPPPVQQTDDFNYDLYYANWLMNDPVGFRNLMKIIYEEYSGISIFLAVNMDLIGNIAESFMKFIQQRYGINCYIINDQYDLMYAMDSGTSFSMEGLANLDMDKEKIAILGEASLLNNQENPYDYIMGDEDEWRNMGTR